MIKIQISHNIWQVRGEHTYMSLHFVALKCKMCQEITAKTFTMGVRRNLEQITYCICISRSLAGVEINESTRR